MSNYIFVYGTLLSAFNNPAAQRLRNESRFVGSATIKGSLYDTGNYPALVFDSKDKVFGELYEIINPNTLKWLDDYEEVPVLYVRREVKAKCEGIKYKAFVYEYAGHVYQFEKIEGGCYLKRISQNSHIDETVS